MASKEIRFRDFSKTPFNGSYEVFSNYLVADDGLNDGLGNIKNLKDLSVNDLQSLAHIAFYSFISNEIENFRSKEVLKDWMNKRAQNYFQNIPKDYRAQVVQSTYAVFVDKKLEEKDREWLAQNILESRITSDFERTFEIK